jgi:hypothetical protein
VAGAVSWARLQDKYPSQSLFPDAADPIEIVQGTINDCYFLTAASAVAEKSDRLQKLFPIKTTNKEGIYAVTLYVKGKPTTITVDESIPFLNSNTLGSKPSSNGAHWVQILEKAYAKMVGNYEIIANGW